MIPSTSNKRIRSLDDFWSNKKKVQSDIPPNLPIDIPPQIIIHNLLGIDESSIEQHLILPLEIQVNPTLFEELWKLKPETRGTIILANKEHTLRRFQLHLGQDYHSGSLHHASSPIDLHPYFLLIQKWVREHSKDAQGYNQMLINFYVDQNDYIGYHSDDTSQLVNNSNIYSFSFGQERQFVISSKTDSTFKWKTQTFDNSVLIMRGKCQEHYKHSITSSKKILGRRLNITMRNFKAQEKVILPIIRETKEEEKKLDSIIVVNKHQIEHDSLTDVYIGRPSMFGNPFSIGKDGNRDQVIEKHRQYLWNNKKLLRIVRNDLVKSNATITRLVCFCAPKRCHGTNYIEIVNLSDEQFNTLYNTAK